MDTIKNFELLLNILNIRLNKAKINFVVFSGASGVVRKCVERSTEKQFAVKIIDLIGVEDESDKTCLEESTLREISILKQMERHPNIGFDILIIKLKIAIAINLWFT